MISKIAADITDQLLSRAVIKVEDKEIYQYGFKQLLAFLANIISTLLIAVLFGKIAECLFFFLTYIILRSFAGGVHAKTMFRCYVFSNLLTVVALLVISNVRLGGPECVIILGISSVIIYKLAPVETATKPLDLLERRVYRRNTLTVLGIDIIIIWLCGLFRLKIIMECMLIALLFVSIVLVLGAIKNKLR